MRSIRLAVACLLFGLSLASLASAQTPLSGNVYDGSGGPLVLSGSPYVVPAFGSFSVPAGQTLTVDPGVEIRFMENALADVYGTLNANATALNPIQLSTNTAGQFWFALIIRSGGTANLRFCDVSNGGRNGNTMIIVQDAATLSLDQSRVRLSQGDGISGTIGSTGPGNVSVTRCTIANNGANGINLTRGTFGAVTLSDNDLTGNTASAFRLGPDIYPSGGSLSGNGFNGLDLVGGNTTVSGTYAHTILINQFAPVSVTVGTTLTLSPGIEVRLRREGTFLDVYGTLIANGTPGSHIHFVPHIAGQYFQPVIFRAGSKGNMSYCDLDYGTPNMIGVQDPANVSIDHSSFRFGQSDGLSGYVGNGGPSALTVTNCVFSQNAFNGVELNRGPSGSVTLSDNAFLQNVGSALRLGPDIYPTGGLLAGNGFNGIDLVGGNVSVSGTYEHDLLFNQFSPSIVPVGVTLTLAAGVEVRFRQGGTYLDVSGELKANGSASNLVRFLPHLGNERWGAVILRSGSRARFQYCDFTTGLTGMLVMQDPADVTIDHSIFRYCLGEGMSGLIGTSIPGTLNVTNCDFVNNSTNGGNLRLGPSATVGVTCNIFSGNGNDGLIVNGGSPAVSSNAFFNNTGAGFNNAGPTTIDATNNWWGSAGGPAPAAGGDSIAVTGGGSVISSPWALSPNFPGCGAVLDAGPRPTAAAFRLYPCTPNPVNGPALIRFDLPRAARVQLRVFDIQGRQVETLANGWRDAGTTTLSFDAASLKSGVYFYRLETNGFRDTERLVRMP